MINGSAYRLTHQQLVQIPILWKKIASENNGKFRHIHSKAPTAIAGAYNEATSFELNIPTNFGRAVKITASEHHPLKVKCLFKKDLGYTLKVFPEGAYEKVGKLLGRQDLQIGISHFDSKFIIRSNNVEFTKKLLSTQTVEQLLSLNIYDLVVDKDEYSAFTMMPIINEANEEKMRMMTKLTLDLVARLNGQ